MSDRTFVKPSSSCYVSGRAFSGSDLQNVPFQIATKYITCSLSSLGIDMQAMFWKQRWNPDKYKYSFELEENVLRTIDMNCLKESDI